MNLFLKLTDKNMKKEEKPYRFNPEQYGFEPVSKFPELNNGEWFGINTFIKVSAVGEKKMFGRKVYWYLACHLESGPLSSDLITFHEHAYSADKPAFGKFNEPRTVYKSTISSDDFAKMLLYHLLGTNMNKNVMTDGVKRFEANLNEELRKEYPV